MVDTATLQITDSNRKASETFGFQPEELHGKPFFELIQPWDVEKFRLALAQSNFSSPELRGITAFQKDGKVVEVDLLIRAVRLEGGEALLVVLADAAPRIRLEEQLRQAQKMESVGMLAGGIAHDFNNLLTIISGYSHMLVSSLADDERNRSAAEQVIRASDRAAALTKQLLSFSRRQVAQNRVFDLNALVHGMTPMLHRIIGEHIRLRIAPGEALGRIHADAGQIEQVIMNLVVNARDAMPEGGTLWIETQNRELDAQYVGRHMEARPGNYVMLAVTDTGIGMDEATRGKVFEPFFTTKESGQGTGLGLSMVYGIAKRCGGSVDVYSEPGKGTVVKLYFPRAEASAMPAVADVSSKPGRGWETILLVEDEEAVRNIVRTALEAQGYCLLVAGTGEEALQISKTHEGPIHLLVTDIVLPQLSGRDVARRLHKKRPAMGVLFMSGYTDVTLNHGTDPDQKVHFLGKPFAPGALARKVRELLDEASDGADEIGHGAG